MNTPNVTRARPLTGPDDPRHGTDKCYTYWRCRCDRCKAAHAIAARGWRGAAPAARCPNCDSQAAGQPVVKVEHGVNHAFYLCPLGHAWETRWMVTQP